MRRRDLVFSSVGLCAVASPATALASAPGKIGYLHPRTISARQPTRIILGDAWRQLGYVEGDTVLLRSADNDARRLPVLVSELIAEGAGVLIVVGAEAVRAASRVTKTVPIVAIDLETDPVRAGYAASLARPGGNVTGLFLDQPALAGKWIDLLREAAPDIERLVLLWDRGTGVDQLEIAKAVAREKGFEAVVLELGTISSFEQALSGLAGAPRTGIVPMTSPGFFLVAGRLADAARKNRLPTIGFLRSYAQAGLLMSYGPIHDRYFEHAVDYADRILKGAKAGDLPIVGPVRFELVINRRTAKAIGLKIPLQLLLLADEVID